MRICITDHDVAEGIEVANTPLKFSGSPDIPTTGAPVAGGETAAIAAELGLEPPPVVLAPSVSVA